VNLRSQRQEKAWDFWRHFLYIEREIGRRWMGELGKVCFWKTGCPRMQSSELWGNFRLVSKKIGPADAGKNVTKSRITETPCIKFDITKTGHYGVH
jgi:hypothetical protein